MTLYHGDCLEEMKSIPDGSVDMVLTDPPYGTTACKWDSIIPLEPMWEQLKRIIKPNGAIVMTASQPFTTTLIASNMKMFKQSLVWVKNKASGHLNAKHRHLVKHEDIVVFYSKPPTYNPQFTQGHKPSNYAKQSEKNSECYGSSKRVVYAHHGKTQRYPTTLVDILVMNNDGSNGKKAHPTQKPVALMEYLIKTYTNEGETVLDFTMGSGTCGVAALNTNRQFIGIEKDDEYFEIASNRIKEADLEKVA